METFSYVLPRNVNEAKGVFWCIVACKSELHAWQRAPIGFDLEQECSMCHLKFVYLAV